MEDFGTPEEMEEMIQRAMAQSGMTREQLIQIGQQGIDYQNKKAVADPEVSGTSAGRDEIRRFMGGVKNQMDLNEQSPEARAMPVGSPVGPGAGLQQAAPPVSQFAEREAPRGQTPSAAALGRAYSGRISELERELDQERSNNLRNAGDEAFSEASALAEREAIESTIERIEGSPDRRARLAEAQNRRALARGGLQKRLAKLNKPRRA